MLPETRSYHIKYALGKGGFGTVYRADLIGPGGFAKAVAIKLLNADMEGMEEIAQRMRDEARMLGMIRHRAIVQVDGLVMLDGRWAIVMEFVEGVDLSLVVDNGVVPAGPALEIIEEVANALHVAYDKPSPSGQLLKLLHRDIKPANIQLTAQGEVKVLDFGIARAEFDNREAETRNMMFGSQNYMAPERLDFIEQHEGDVYSLGSVLFELLTATMFGKAQASPKRHSKQATVADEKLFQLGLDPDVIELVMAMLSYEPEDRPTAKEVSRAARQLVRALDHDSLVDWAEGVVPGLIRPAGEVSNADALTGRLLREETTGVVKVDDSGPVAPVGTPGATQAWWSAEEQGAPKPPKLAAAAAAPPQVPPAPESDPMGNAETTFAGSFPIGDLVADARDGQASVNAGSNAKPDEAVAPVVPPIAQEASSAMPSTGSMVGGAAAALGGGALVTSLIVIVGLLVVIGGGAGWYFMMGPGVGPSDPLIIHTADVGSPTPPPEGDDVEVVVEGTDEPGNTKKPAPRGTTQNSGGVADAQNDAVADVGTDPASTPDATTEPNDAPRGPDIELCGDQGALETAGSAGTLPENDQGCLRTYAADAENKMTDRRRLAKILLVNYQSTCTSGKGCADYENFQPWYFSELDRSDGTMLLAWVVHIYKNSDGSVGANKEVVKWAERGLERKSSWKSVEFVKNVDRLYEIRARAAYAIWSTEKKADSPTTDKSANRARVATVDWMNNRLQLGKNADEARKLCQSVTGSGSVCERQSQGVAVLTVITFISAPLGAAVMVDGKEVGKAPMTLELSKGNHAVKMSLSDGAAGEMAITVGPREPVRYVWKSASSEWIKGY